MAEVQPGVIQRRWRVILAALVGIAVLFVARAAGLMAWLSALLAWNGAAASFLLTTGWMFWRSDEVSIRRRAAAEDEAPLITMAIVLSAVAVGLAATVAAMHESKAPHAAGAAAWILSVSSLFLGWLTMQTIFTLHYAHSYFGAADKGADPGVQFIGDPPTTYSDFLYMAVCVGVSGQVSDFNITNRRYRRLITLHALLAFFFNTAVLALGINILAGLIGQ
ncbi:MAG TPA: DUF1345 domain-containing protein [Caulobacteraceae bacterium]|jgi:uncharacterized membrane protein